MSRARRMLQHSTGRDVVGAGRCTIYRRLGLVTWIAVLAIGAGSASAQSVTRSGDVSPAFTPGAVVDLTGTPIIIGFTTAGVGTLGAVNVSGGGLLSAAAIAPGAGGLGIGNVTVTGTSSTITLTGG